MSDACGCSDETMAPGTAGEEKAEGFWQVREVRAAAVSGVLLLAGWITSLVGGPQWLTLPLMIVGLFFLARALRRPMLPGSPATAPGLESPQQS